MTVLLAFTLAYSGFTALSLAMERHQRDVLGHRLTEARARWLRQAGWPLVVTSLLPFLTFEAWTVGLVFWCGVLTVASGLVVLVIAFLPRALIPSGVVTVAVGAAGAFDMLHGSTMP